MTPDSPSYKLSLVQQLVRDKRYRITWTALNGAGELGLDEDDVLQCVLVLDESHFYKTMSADKRPGLWQDVYHPHYAGFELYVKLQLVEQSPAEMVVVISFKRL